MDLINPAVLRLSGLGQILNVALLRGWSGASAYVTKWDKASGQISQNSDQRVDQTHTYTPAACCLKVLVYKGRNVLFNDKLNTFYLHLYDVGKHWSNVNTHGVDPVTYHTTDIPRTTENTTHQHGLFFPLDVRNPFDDSAHCGWWWSQRLGYPNLCEYIFLKTFRKER